MNHALDSAAYGASRELYSGHDNYGCGEPVPGMELQPDWEFVQSRGRLGTADVRDKIRGELLPVEQVEMVRAKIRRGRIRLKDLARNIGFGHASIHTALSGTARSNNKTFKALKAYFGLEG